MSDRDDIHFDAPFQTGRTLALAVGLFAKQFVPFVGLSLLFSLPVIVWGYIAFDSMSLSEIEDYDSYATIPSTILNTLATAIIVLMSFQSLSGRKASLSAAVGASLKRSLSLLGAAILLGLAIGLGLMLLVVPGIIFATLLAVTVPAIMCEEMGAIDAMTRSNTLVSGYGGAVFGVIFVAFLPSVAFGVVGYQMITSGSMDLMTFFFTMTVIDVLQRAFMAVCTATIYTELRRVKEGVESETLLDIFA